ncbi:hypothetical protein F0562_020945 [Nyssa sinensis]|uniref:DUF241 domain protein n=1 Tax=Nyssa sinensis TaxID=561372 RepID=A0A5J5BY32_9ASTE|nr:hypothetical protein F0562_020945 [Nyssa sinensis]
MASSSFRSKTRFHARSVSFPSRLHPINPQFDEHLCRVSATEETSSSLSSISNKISGLEDLYDCMDDLLLLPQTQQAFLQERHEKWVGEALEGHLTLLDVCATAKDVFSQTRQNVQQLLSTLRRKRDPNDFGGYLISRKKEKKVIQKSIKDLKIIKNKHTLLAMNKDHETVAIVSMLNEVEAVTLDVFESLLSYTAGTKKEGEEGDLEIPKGFKEYQKQQILLAMDKDHETVAIVSMLNEVEAVTLAVFESLLSYIAGTKVQSRPSGWSLISKLMHHKTVSSQDKETDTNEFERIDAALHSLIGDHKTSKSDNILHNQLGKLESSIQDLEEGLESLFRRVIKTRVSLLNVVNH